MGALNGAAASAYAPRGQRGIGTDVLRRLESAVVRRRADHAADGRRARRRLARSQGAGFPRALALACSGALLLVSVAPVGALLIEPLEDRFPPPPADIARALWDHRSRRRDRRRGERGARPDDFRRRRRAPDRGGDPGAALSRRRASSTPAAARRFGTRIRPRRWKGASSSSPSASIPRGSRSRTSRATPTKTPASPRRSSIRSRTRPGCSSPPPITCRARWGCSSRRDFPFAPIPSIIARWATRAIGG